MKPTFRLLPRNKGEWWQVALFPFQAYVIVAHVVERYFVGSVAYPYRGMMDDFTAWVLAGFVVCFPVLLIVGIEQMFTGHRLRGFLNICLAVLAGWFAHSTNFVIA